jgi:hypothetical protein
MATLTLALALSPLSDGVSSAAASEPRVTDCPLARAPYSANTPLIDILLNPAAKAVLDRNLPNLFDHVPPSFKRTSVPTFASIITIRDMIQMGGFPTDRLSTIDEELAAIPITAADVRIRCARYDAVPPTLPSPRRHPALLIFDKITGFRDTASVEAAEAALRAMAERRGWYIAFTNNGAVFSHKQLARYDAVIWNNVSGDALTLPQQKAFKAYLARGGGFAGIHGSGGDFFYAWPWYADTLIGARFLGHPDSPPLQAARVVVDDPKNAIVSGLGVDWTMTEEWYSFRASPRLTGAHILVRLDEATYNPVMHGTDIRMGDHPVAWTRCVGNGRSFYTALGHRPESYSEPHSIELLEKGVAWAAGMGTTRCFGGREVAR